MSILQPVEYTDWWLTDGPPGRSTREEGQSQRSSIFICEEDSYKIGQKICGAPD
jgi:hypothetical protein